MIIKVGDLLREGGLIDVVKFEGIKIKGLDNLTDKGVSGEIHLQSLNKTDIVAIFKNIVAYLNDVSDISLEKFVRKVEIKEYEIKYTTSIENIGEEFEIDRKSFTVRVDEPLRQCIEIEEPFVHKKPNE